LDMTQSKLDPGVVKQPFSQAYARHHSHPSLQN
jgi:hypothetical protein